MHADVTTSSLDSAGRADCRAPRPAIGTSVGRQLFPRRYRVPAGISGFAGADRPVFVLTGARSGSTLLRFILDSHPDLACPPETGLGGACAGMARVLGVLDGLCQAGVAGRGSVTVRAATAIRQEVEAAYRDHLARRGKKRWCDKSLDNVHCADLLAKLWPRAQFVCLTRHCMDVIASVLEACPWGLSGFGLDRYTAQYPGNNVAPAGASWLATARTMLAFEGKYPGRCRRVRYEDLVTQPEQVAAGIFSFLGVRQMPGITRECFRDQHEANGPGDAKIWFTSAVHAGSVGRGVTVPVAMLPPAMRTSISQTLERLGYQPVTPDWNNAGVPLTRAL